MMRDFYAFLSVLCIRKAKIKNITFRLKKILLGFNPPPPRRHLGDCLRAIPKMAFGRGEQGEENVAAFEKVELLATANIFHTTLYVCGSSFLHP